MKLHDFRAMVDTGKRKPWHLEYLSAAGQKSLDCLSSFYVGPWRSSLSDQQISKLKQAAHPTKPRMTFCTTSPQ